MPRPASTARTAYIVTGPTSGIGRAAALALAEHGTVVLVGRDRGKLDAVRTLIEGRGGSAVTVPCDLSDIADVRRAAAESLALRLPLVGLLNNAGIHQVRATRNALGWDMTYATNHLGPFALTEALAPHLPDGAKVLFVASGVEDPERKPAVAAGFRVARTRGCVSTPASRASTRAPRSDARATPSYGSCCATSSRRSRPS